MKTKLIVVLTLIALFVAACGAAGSPANPASADQFAGMTATAMISAAQTEVGSITNPTSEPTSLPTESATPLIPAATQAPTITPMPVLTDGGTPDCKNHGTVAWQNDNQVSGASYGEAPVGGLDETCWVVAQTWWTDANGDHRALFAVEPNSVAWLSGHLGGTGWYFSGTLAEVKANLAEQAKQLLERDGEMDTIIVILPDEKDSFPLVTRIAQK